MQRAANTSQSEVESAGVSSRPLAYRPRRGLSIPSITVLDSSGRIIEAEQRRVFRHIAQNGRGADILFAGGTTGELNRISNHERQRLIRILAEEVAALRREILRSGGSAPEAWVGISAATRNET